LNRVKIGVVMVVNPHITARELVNGGTTKACSTVMRLNFSPWKHLVQFKRIFTYWIGDIVEIFPFAKGFGTLKNSFIIRDILECNQLIRISIMIAGSCLKRIFICKKRNLE